MSERNKADVSPTSRVNNNRVVVKNPLLSASVTGLCFDDFPNKPLLLPAAPPVVHATPPPPHIASMLNREPKTLVTVGQTSSIDDNETLDEINLNASGSDDLSANSSAHNLYQSSADANANPLLEPAPTGDSLLSQAASSFGALPAVASNVFSTFSKRIYAGARESEQQPQLDIQPTYIQQADQAAPPPPAPFYAAPPTLAGELAPGPPKFYAPTEVPAVTATPLPPTAANAQSHFRISAKKKAYAPIPGFSEQLQQQQQLPTAQFATPPYPTAAPASFEPAAALVPAPEERSNKSSAGLFSLSNLVPSGVLQNISGLVQSATGRASSEPSAAPNSYTAATTGYFDLSQVSAAAAPTPTPTGYFPPTAAPAATAANYFQPAPVNYFQPEPTPAATPPVVAAVPTATVASFAPPTAATPINYFQPEPTPVATPPLVAAPPSAAAPVNYFQPESTPAAAPTAAVNYFQPEPTPTPPLAAALPPVNYFQPEPTSAIVAPPPTATPVSYLQPESTQAAAASSAPVNYFQPEPTPTPPLAAALPPVAAAVNYFQPEPTPPVVAATVAPPPAAATQTSYRLQKGTRLYKSPLTAQETTNTAPAAIFNPFAAAAAPANLFNPEAQAASPAFFTPQPADQAAPPTAPQSLFNPQVQQPHLFPPTSSVQEVSSTIPLFAPAATQEQVKSLDLFAAPATNKNESLFNTQVQQQQPLFAPAATQEQIKSVDLFTAPPTAHNESLVHPQIQQQDLFPPTSTVQEVPLFAPAVEQAKSEQLFTAPTTNQNESLFAPQVQQQHLFAPPTSVQDVSPTIPWFAPVEQSKSEYQLAATPTEQNEFLFNPQVQQQQPLFTPISSAQEATVPLFATAAEQVKSVDLFTPTAPQFVSTQSESLFNPQVEEQELFAPATSVTEVSPTIPAAEQSKSEDLFVAPTTNQNDSLFNTQVQQQHLFTPTAATETQSQGINLFTPATNQELPIPTAQIDAGETAKSNEASQAAKETLIEATTVDSSLDTAAATQATALFPPLPNVPQSIALSTQTNTTTYFNPFASSISTALPQDLLPPPQGFVAANDNSNLFAAQTIEPVPTDAAQSTLQSFFAPNAATSSDFNPFATQAPPALGFELLLNNTQQATSPNEILQQQNSSVNSCSGYFAPAATTTTSTAATAVTASATAADSLNFFDHFAIGSAQGQEEQRIQNFFNNPPLQEQPAAPGELKYDIVHSGLSVQHYEQRSQTSQQVEPPSSACSEFSNATALVPPPQSQPATAPAAHPTDYLLQLHQGELPEEILQQLRMAHEKGVAITPPADSIVYTPALPHWFYKRTVDGKHIWTPFSHYDSALLETSLTSADSFSVVPVEGGRYDVNIKERTKTPVFWEGKAIEVRRCSWFYKGSDSRYVPYAEQVADALEAEYKRATETGEWHKKIPLSNGEQVMMHGPTVIVHFMPQPNSDTWGASVQSSSRPLVVKRDLNDFKIQQGESQRVDHLLFMVHGIGSACDLKMRNVEEVVDDFRLIAQQLVQSHYKNSTDMGLVGRVEVLPIEWHGHLHSEELGIDEKLKSITLESIPRLRNFTNDTLLDVLFYTSPKYCQKIMNTVADALNETYLKYRMRHPEFNGGVSLAGHSLGSLILFDLLCHQEPLKESEEENKENPDQLPQQRGAEAQLVQLPNNEQLLPKQVSYAMGVGHAGTGQPVINYTQLIFQPKKFFALGSPIGMFVTIRGIDKLGLDFRLPTCAGFYNIFHPFDPVAYRIEALVNPDMKGIRPVLIPHHKGRKRMHLELKETMTRVGADIKQRFMDTFKTTLDSVNFLATVTKVKKEAEESLEKSSSTQIYPKLDEHDESSVASTSTHVQRHRSDSESTTTSDPEFIELDFPLGKLNDSKRVDYVLQEAPLEFINEYIFALSSHVCYWGSEDTILFVMKEIYAGLGISTDSQVPQQSMTIERPSSRNNSVSQSLLPM
ncbi:CG8552 [Drosophila busckii]|uniref:CG8552 n=1 Tax=Drosophila busckii TaxID=30019 RepID=A0A0M4ESQ3_DROBS|nr:CG8552 [Drosophila busckii]